MVNNSAMRLVFRHDCSGSGCRASACALCANNPNQLCKRNLRDTYSVNEYITATCNATVRVELLASDGTIVMLNGDLEVCLLDGGKYDEICPNNTWMSKHDLRSCFMPGTKSTLKWDDGDYGDDDEADSDAMIGALNALPNAACNGCNACNAKQYPPLMQLEQGKALLSDLRIISRLTSNQTLRLMVWVIDQSGEPVKDIFYVVSESFVLSPMRNERYTSGNTALSITDPICSLVHVGNDKAAMDKLMDVRGAAKDMGIEFEIAYKMNKIENVGQFRLLLDLDREDKMSKLLELSQDKWDNVSHHALSAVEPDSRTRVWWCASIRTGLLFACKNGVLREGPIALVKLVDGQQHYRVEINAINQFEPALLQYIPKLTSHAMQLW